MHFYGSKGYLSINANGRYKVFLGRDKEPQPDMGKLDDIDHYGNFIDAVRAANRALQTADIEQTYLSCAICHLGNIAYRTQRVLRFDPASEKFIGDADADRFLTGEYRHPFVVLEKV